MWTGEPVKSQKIIETNVKILLIVNTRVGVDPEKVKKSLNMNLER